MPVLAADEVRSYLRRVFGSDVDVEYIGELGKERAAEAGELKAFGYGTPYLITFTVGGKRREAVISTMRVGGGFGHDFRSDRASNLLLAYDTWSNLPRHAKVYDFGALTKRGRMVSLGDSDEFFLLREKVEGREYYLDLDRIFAAGALLELDRERCRALSAYIAKIHSLKKDEPELYARKIRDTVGHGECILGLSDSYPRKPSFLGDKELQEIEKKCVEHRWRLRWKAHRLSQVHGDFHPWNVLFKEGVDFILLDRSRGEFGEPADDVAAMSINYIFYSLRKYGSLNGEFEELLDIFMDNYLGMTKDFELLEVLPLFYAFRCLVIASPVWYPSLEDDTRRKIFNFAHSVLDEGRFDPKEVNNYLA